MEFINFNLFIPNFIWLFFWGVLFNLLLKLFLIILNLIIRMFNIFIHSVINFLLQQNINKEVKLYYYLFNIGCLLISL